MRRFMLHLPFRSAPNEANGRRVPVTFSVCFPRWCLIFFPLVSLSFSFPTFDSNSSNNSLISVPLCNLSSPPPSHQTAHRLARSSLRHTNEGQRVTPHFWLLPLGSHPPDTLFTPPQPLRQASSTARCRLSASHYPIPSFEPQPQGEVLNMMLKSQDTMK